jgi:hypothetical protein
LEGSYSSLFEGTILAFAVQKEKLRKPSIRTAGNLAEIGNVCLPNVVHSVNRYTICAIFMGSPEKDTNDSLCFCVRVQILFEVSSQKHTLALILLFLSD